MTTLLRTDYDRFLFAPVGEGANGMPLTVISVLARLDVDAWEEAATLAALPAESAAQRLASILAAPPNACVPAEESVAVATRLVALLQRAPAPSARSAQSPPPVQIVAMPGKPVNRTIYYLIAVIFLLAWQWAAATHQSQIPPDASPGTTATALERSIHFG